MKVKLEDVCKNESSNLMQKDVINRNGHYPIYGAAGKIGNVDFYHQMKSYVAVVKDGAGIGRTMLLPAKSSVIGTMQYLVPCEVVIPQYLYYVVKHMHLEKYYTGATIPHIYFKDYKKEVFNLSPLDKQEEIVEILNRIEKLIDYKRQVIQKLQELIKARFVEMFGDPISNEKSWETSKLLEVTNKIGSGATPKGGKESYISEGISLIRSLNVHDGKFLYKDLAYITDEQAHQLDNVKVFPYDVFINITGASVARSCVVPLDVLPARVNQHVSIVRCNKQKLNPIFANQQFLNSSFKKHLLGIGESGGATRQAITKQQLEQLTIIVPPLSLQCAFASFIEQIDKSKLRLSTEFQNYYFRLQFSNQCLDNLEKSLSCILRLWCHCHHNL